MVTFKDLVSLSGKYGYDLNHNLRYLALAELIRYHSIKEVLILGCGKGVLEYILPDEVECTSIDIDSKEIETAAEINSGRKNRNFILGDMFKIARNMEKKFQAVVTSEVIEHLKDDKTAIELARRLMKSPDSLYLLTVPNKNRLLNKIYPAIGRKIEFMSEQHLREYSVEEIHRLLSSCGFRVIRAKYVYFRFPKEDFIRKVIPVDNRLRELILKAMPAWANYIITVSSPSRKES